MGICNSDTKEVKKENERPKLSPEEKAILDCKQARDKIKAYIKRLENNEQQKKEFAKEMLKNKNKEKAKYFLSQCKLYKMQRESAEGQLAAVEDQINRLDVAKTQKEVFTVLENTNKVLKDLQQEVNIEKLEKISDDLKDIKENNDEISNFFKNHNVDLAQNEEEIDKEMEKLMQSQSNELANDFPEARKEILKENKPSADAEKKEEEKKVMLEA
jgi:charged multivesicular body protein 6